MSASPVPGFATEIVTICFPTTAPGVSSVATRSENRPSASVRPYDPGPFAATPPVYI